MSVLELRVNSVSFDHIRKDRHYCALSLDLIGKSEPVPDDFYVPDWSLDKRASQEYGSDWYLRKSSLFLEVKSAVLPVERNYIINTTHPAFNSLAFSTPLPIPLDPRLN